MSVTVIFGQFLISILKIYFIILIVRVVFSWLVLPPSRFTYYLNLVTDPVLNLSRKIFPLRIGIIDLSIFFPFIALTLLQSLINDLMINGEPFNAFYVIKFLLLSIGMILNSVFTILIIFCIILIVINLLKIYSYNPMITAIKSAIDYFTMIVRRLIRINSVHSEIIYLTIVLFSFILLWILIGVGIDIALQQARLAQSDLFKILPSE